MRNLGGRQSSKFARHCGTKVQSRRLGSVLRSSRRTRSSRWSEMAALRSAWLGQPRAAGETDGSTMEWSNELLLGSSGAWKDSRVQMLQASLAASTGGQRWASMLVTVLA